MTRRKSDAEDYSIYPFARNTFATKSSPLPMYLHCPGCSRRDFLTRVTGGFGALALGTLARAAVPLDPITPFLPRPPHFAPKAKSVIFLYMVGGPSSVDTFDYKPELQRLGGKPVPASIREALKNSRHANVFEGCKDELMASPFSAPARTIAGSWKARSSNT